MQPFDEPTWPGSDPPAGTPRRAPLAGSRKGLWIALSVLFLALLGVFGLVAVVLVMGLGGDDDDSTGFGRDRIGLIRVSGVIGGSGEPSLLGGSGGANAGTLTRQIRAAARDKSVKVVILQINSPGGAAGSSQEIYDAVMDARAHQHTKFVASMGDVAASGGYYIASACDRIVALRATMTGSIGVIMSGYNWSGLMKRFDVTDTTITSGKFKAVGSPSRPMTDEGRDLLQAMVNNTYEQFLGDVAKGRGKPVEAIRPYADGRALTGEQALHAGLVDELGGFWHAVKVAEKLGGLRPSDHPQLHSYSQRSLLGDLLESRATALPPAAGLPSGLSPLWFVLPGALPQTLTADTPPAAR